MKLYGLIGEKLSHSLSPFIHGEILTSLGIINTYSLFEVQKQDLPNAVNALKTLGFSGVNVTIPYKQLIMPYLDEISPEAQKIGAVNTIYFHDGKAVGYNTDYFGFGSMLTRHNIDTGGKSIVLYGAGGAAKALIQFFRDGGAAEIHVVARTPVTLDAMKKQFPFIYPHILADYAPAPKDIAVNATPVGMYPNIHQSVVDGSYIQKYGVCIDIVYNPLQTRFLSIAQAHGLKAVDGLYMLIDQAIKAQEIFQQRKIPLTIGEGIYSVLSKKFL